jgi:citrate lyase subunit beta / citryl-CoA lyase
MIEFMQHPRQVLLGVSQAGAMLPVCDHYCGVESKIKKSLWLQADMTRDRGACPFDVTLDCEDGAPVGGELEHAEMVAEMLSSSGQDCRVGVRVHDVAHPSFIDDVSIILGKSAVVPSYIMLPKVDTLQDVEQAVMYLNSLGATQVPLHALIESPKALQHAFDIAAHPRVQSLSFGLMDFVSAHAGAIPSSAMGVAGQFYHPLVVRAKLEVAGAAHAHGKTPSHCVVTEYRDLAALREAATQARYAMGYTRMWSIHPAQIEVLLEVFLPLHSEIEKASRIVIKAWQQEWAPMSLDGQLHDRASYRYFWQVLERAHQAGQPLPDEIRQFFQS